MRLRFSAFALLFGCVLVNPAYNASEAGSATTETPTETLTGTTSAGSGQSESLSSSTGFTVDSDTTTATGSTGTTSSTNTSTDTSADVGCADRDVEVLMLEPSANTYVVKGDSLSCQWRYSNTDLVNPEDPCQVLNFGSKNAKYTLIGVRNDERGEYLVAFGLAQVMLQHPDQIISSARLNLVLWSPDNRQNVTIDIGQVSMLDLWEPGVQKAEPATVGANWLAPKKIGMEQVWSGGMGPSSGAEWVAKIEVPELPADSDEFRTSSLIPAAVLNSWIADTKSDRGFVVYTEEEPLLVQNMHTEYRPKLELRLCPKE